MLRHRGELDQAGDIIGQALEDFRNLRCPSDRRDAKQVEVDLVEQLADVHSAAGRYSEAVPLYRQVLDMMRQLMRERQTPYAFFAKEFRGLLTDPDVSDNYQPDRFCAYIETQQKLARALRQLGRPFEAELILFQTQRTSLLLALRHEEVLRYHVAFANTLAELGQLFAGRRREASRHLLLASAEKWYAILEQFPAATSFKSGLRGNQADLAWFFGEYPEYVQRSRSTRRDGRRAV